MEVKPTPLKQGNRRIFYMSMKSTCGTNLLTLVVSTVAKGLFGSKPRIENLFKD